MKQIFLPVLFIGLLSNIFAQTYTPMAVDSSTWLMSNTDPFPQLSETVVLRIEGDTIVNNLLYSKIYHYDVFLNEVSVSSRKILGLVRDDINERRVYGGLINGVQYGFETFLNTSNQCDWDGVSSFNERLLYDFSLQTGDTINSCMYSSPTTITSIETIERHGYERRNYTLDDSEYSIMTEGIGTCIGIFKGEQCYLTGGGYSFYLYNYCIGSFSNCNIITPIKESYFDAHIKIFPNPVKSDLFIESTLKFKKLSLFDISGNLIFSSRSRNQIDMSTFIEGIYILKIQDENDNIYSRKIIKN